MISSDLIMQEVSRRTRSALNTLGQGIVSQLKDQSYHVEVIDSQIYSLAQLLIFADRRWPEEELVTIDIEVKDGTWSIDAIGPSPLLDDLAVTFDRDITGLDEIPSLITDIEDLLDGWRNKILAALLPLSI